MSIPPFLEGKDYLFWFGLIKENGMRPFFIT